MWIDALCINQDDLDERSQQVSLMKDVYSRAEQVVVWLGEEEEETEGVILLIEIIAREVREFLGNEQFLHQKSVAEKQVFDARMLQMLPAPRHQHWDAIWRFYGPPWFSRVWVLQEVCVARNRTMITGGHTTTWDTIGPCMNWLYSAWDKVHPKGLPPLDGAYSMYLLIPQFKSTSIPSPLLVVLSMTSTFHATDPRDKVFAILGLVANEKELMSNSLTRPNYHKDIIDVLMDAVCFTFSPPGVRAGGASALRAITPNEHAHGGPDDSGSWQTFERDGNEQFPSWVPRWDLTLPAWSQLSLKSSQNKWAAAIDLPLSMRHERATCSLFVRGIPVSSVTNICPISFSDWLSHTKQLVTQLFQTRRFFHGSGSFNEALALTLTSHLYSEMDEELAPIVNAFKAWNHEDIDFEKELLFREAILGCYNLIYTGNGSMGSGSPRLQEGDQIWILFGGQVLYALRPVEKYYMFLGECFVWGLMKGEGIDMWKRGELKDEWAELR